MSTNKTETKDDGGLHMAAQAFSKFFSHVNKPSPIRDLENPTESEMRVMLEEAKRNYPDEYKDAMKDGLVDRVETIEQVIIIALRMVVKHEDLDGYRGWEAGIIYNRLLLLAVAEAKRSKTT